MRLGTNLFDFSCTAQYQGKKRIKDQETKIVPHKDTKNHVKQAVGRLLDWLSRQQLPKQKQLRKSGKEMVATGFKHAYIFFFKSLKSMLLICFSCETS